MKFNTIFHPRLNAAAPPTADAPPSTPGAPGSGSAATPVHFNPDGTFGDNWHTALGDEFAPHASQLGTFKDVGGLAKSYLHLRAHGPTYPGQGAAQEDVDRFRTLAQVPREGTPAGYGIQLPTDLPESEKKVFDRITKVAHDHHIPGSGLGAVVKEYQAILAEQQANHDAEVAATTKAAEDTLVAKWGTHYEANKSTARHVLSTLAGQAGIPGDDPSLAAILNNPALAMIAVEFSKATSEDSTRMPAGYSNLQSASQRAEAIMNGTDPTWGKKYTEGTTEEQAAAYQEVSRLLNESKK